MIKRACMALPPALACTAIMIGAVMQHDAGSRRTHSMTYAAGLAVPSPAHGPLSPRPVPSPPAPPASTTAAFAVPSPGTPPAAGTTPSPAAQPAPSSSALAAPSPSAPWPAPAAPTPSATAPAAPAPLSPSPTPTRTRRRLPSGTATATSFWDAQTASGKPMRYQTIASPYWPLGTKVKITYRGKSVIGFVEDFGPAEWAVAQHRVPAILDLSELMMADLTGVRSNVVLVRFEVLEWGSGRVFRRSGTGHDLAMGRS